MDDKSFRKKRIRNLEKDVIYTWIYLDPPFSDENKLYTGMLVDPSKSDKLEKFILFIKDKENSLCIYDKESSVGHNINRGIDNIRLATKEELDLFYKSFKIEIKLNLYY